MPWLQKVFKKEQVSFLEITGDYITTPLVYHLRPNPLKCLPASFTRPIRIVTVILHCSNRYIPYQPAKNTVILRDTAHILLLNFLGESCFNPRQPCSLIRVSLITETVLHARKFIFPSVTTYQLYNKNLLPFAKNNHNKSPPGATLNP